MGKATKESTTKKESSGKLIKALPWVKVIKPRTRNQSDLLKNIENSKITFCLGPAGTGKTLIAIAAGLKSVADGRFQKCIVTRPVVDAGRSIGYLPGNLDEKIEPYFIPVFDAFSEVLNPDQITAIRAKRFPFVELVPLTHMRGRTLKESFIVIDEAQNLTFTELKLILTRMGMGSKIVLTGDPRQIDLHPTNQSGLEEVAALLDGIDGVSIIYMDRKDIQREPIVSEMIQRFENQGEKNHARIRDVGGGGIQPSDATDGQWGDLDDVGVLSPEVFSK